MTDAFSDPWINSISSISAERIHAVGVITIRWNQCEFELFHLFREISGLQEAEAWASFCGLRHQEILKKIKGLVEQRNYHTDLVALIDNVLLFLDNCRVNRNAVAHAWTSSMINGEKVLARKSRSRTKMDPIPFPSELLDLRRVADEIETAIVRLWLITCVIEDGSSSLPQPSFGILTLPVSLMKDTNQPKTETQDELI